MPSNDPTAFAKLPKPAGGVVQERLFLRFPFASCAPDPREVCRVMGYPEGETPEVALDAIQGLADRGDALWSLQGGCTIYPQVEIDHQAGRIRVAGTAFEAGKIVCGQLSRASSLAVFLCTAGPGIQQLMDETMAAGDPFTSYVASWMGSLTVENAMDRLQEALAASVADRGLRTTNRYSPGYCGWNVSEQQKLFLLIPPGLCGVRLTDSSLMQPIKTVSGLIGMGDRVRFNAYTCNLCELDDCVYRTMKRSMRESSCPDDQAAHG